MRCAAAATACVTIGFIGFTAIAGPLTPPGAPAPTMKTLDEVEPRIAVNSLPPAIAIAMHDISSPGSYYLTGNITAGAGVGGIRILSSDVTLDLNGFTIDGVAGSNSGVVLGAVDGVTIRNGHIRGMGSNGVLGISSKAVVEDLEVSDCQGDGIRLGQNSVVRRCVIQSSGGAGVRVQNQTLVEDTLVSDSQGGVGISTGHWSRVTDCVVKDSFAEGIRVGQESVVTDCSVSYSGDTGIFISYQGIVTNSISTFNSKWGIELENSSRASLCTVDENDSVGIVGRAGTTIENCKVRANGDSGIYVEDLSQVIGNIVFSNGSNNYAIYGGIVVPLDSCVVKENIMSWNGTNMIVTGSFCTIVKNISTHSQTAGYNIGASNYVGALVSDPSLAGPWDNIDN